MIKLPTSYLSEWSLKLISTKGVIHNHLALLNRYEGTTRWCLFMCEKDVIRTKRVSRLNVSVNKVRCHKDALVVSTSD